MQALAAADRSAEGASTATVRSARFTDVDAIATIKATGWATTYADLVPDGVLAQFADVNVQRSSLGTAIDDPSMIVLVATLGDDMLGFGICQWDDPEGGYLDSLHVLADARGSGVGSLLLREIAQQLNKRRVASMYLHVVAGNTGAGRFYERHGAHHVGSAPAAWAGVVTELKYRWSTLAALLVEAHG